MIVAYPVEYSVSQSQLTVQFLDCSEEQIQMLRDNDYNGLKKSFKLAPPPSVPCPTDILNILSKNKNIKLVPPMSKEFKDSVSFKISDSNPMDYFLENFVSKGYCDYWCGFFNINAGYAGSDFLSNPEYDNAKRYISDDKVSYQPKRASDSDGIGKSEFEPKRTVITDISDESEFEPRRLDN